MFTVSSCGFIFLVHHSHAQLQQSHKIKPLGLVENALAVCNECPDWGVGQSLTSRQFMYTNKRGWQPVACTVYIVDVLSRTFVVIYTVQFVLTRIKVNNKRVEFD